MRINHHTRRGGEQGFTLIELLVVIVILGILSAVVVFSVSGITDRGEASACEATAQTIRVASEAYRAQNGAYSATLAALEPDFISEFPESPDDNVIALSGGSVTYVTSPADQLGTVTDNCAPTGGVGGPGTVAVPNVVGQSEGDATTALEGAGFTVSVVMASSPTVPSGDVISQNPAGTAAPGSDVEITVSTGPEPSVVASVTLVGTSDGGGGSGTLLNTTGSGCFGGVPGANDDCLSGGDEDFILTFTMISGSCEDIANIVVNFISWSGDPNISGEVVTGSRTGCVFNGNVSGANEQWPDNGQTITGSVTFTGASGSPQAFTVAAD